MNVIIYPSFISFLYICISVFFPINSLIAADRSDFDQLVAEYKFKEEEIDAEIQPQMDEAKDNYATILDSQLSKVDWIKYPEKKKVLEEESRRFLQYGRKSGPNKSVPTEVRAAWQKFISTTESVFKSVAHKRRTVRTSFIQSLSQLENTYRAENDAEGMALIRQARASVTFLNAVESNQVGITQVLGRGNEALWQDTIKEGGYIVGFEVSKGSWFQFSVLGSLTPIFVTVDGLRDGQKRGTGGGKRIMAKEGYAVGGLIVRHGEMINCIQIIFMRINADGISLNLHDSYLSEWLGGEGGGNPKRLTAGGRMIIGLTGASGEVVDSIGLISFNK